MAQSSLYNGGGDTTDTTDVTSDDARDLGDVDVKTVGEAVDITDDTARKLGQAQVTNALEVGTWTAGTLATEQQTPITVEDTTGTQVDPATDASVSAVEAAVNTNAVASANAVTLLTNGTETLSCAADGADEVMGRAVSTGSYDVEISWQDGNGNEIFRDAIATGVAGGTETTIQENAILPNADVIVTDTSGADQTLDAGVHMR